MMKIPPLIGNMLMLFLEQANRFGSSPRAFLAAGNFALCPSESLLRFPVELWRLDLCTFAGHEKGFQTHINANSRPVIRWSSNIGQLTREDDIPAIGFPLERDRLDRACHLTMPFHLEQAHMLDVEPTILELAAIALGRELNGIAVIALEARISWILLPFFGTAEEVLEGPQSSL